MKDRRNSIVLVGFMGSGKTSVGLRLSYRLHRPVEDTDKLIERQEGRTVSDIFAAEGEAYFRSLETKLLRELAETDWPRIYSVGGGTPVQPCNRELLRSLGTVVYLRVRPETVYERLKGDTTRPLLQCSDPLAQIREMLESRREAYEAVAHVILDVDSMSLTEITDRIAGKIEKAERIRESSAEKSGVRGKSPRESGAEENSVRGKSPREGGAEESGTIKSGPSGEDGRRGRRLLVINGPNINFLGIREKSVYGNQDYQYLLDRIEGKAQETGSRITVFQSNHEGAIIDRIQAAYFDGTEGIVINPGAFTHYSYAIRDALASISVPKVEIHISDITRREEFRKISVTAPVCDHQIYGQGLEGYLQAVDFVLSRLCGREG